MEDFVTSNKSFLRGLEAYYANQDRVGEDWLQFDQVFDKPGKQGMVGIVSQQKKEENKYVFKLSQYINYLPHHELTVGMALNRLATYFPHFCRVYGGTVMSVNPKIRGKGNPFDLSNVSHPVLREVCLMEKIEGKKLSRYLSSSVVKKDVLVSLIKQVLLAIAVAQKTCKFTHYDLHSDNVMVKKCDSDLVLVYVIDGVKYAIPTHGHIAVLIDYGFAHVDALQGGYAWPSYGFTDIGFCSDRYDPVSDFKLFLITTSYELRINAENPGIVELGVLVRRFAKNCFSQLSLEWDSGWDKGFNRSTALHVHQYVSQLEAYNSTLFGENFIYAIDLVQSLITLPLQERSTKSIDVAYDVFIREIVKIEYALDHPYHSLHILKEIVDSARNVRAEYITEEGRKTAVLRFRQTVLDSIDRVASFVNVKEVDFEKLLCGLYSFSRCLEGLIFEVMEYRMAKKTRRYNSLPLQDPLEYFIAFDLNFPTTVEIDETTTKVVECDIQREKMREKKTESWGYTPGNTGYPARDLAQVFDGGV